MDFELYININGIDIYNTEILEDNSVKIKLSKYVSNLINYNEAIAVLTKDNLLWIDKGNYSEYTISYITNIILNCKNDIFESALDFAERKIHYVKEDCN